MYPYPDIFNQNRYQNNDYFNRNYNQQTIEQPINNLIRVTGIEGAKAYQMPANSTVALFDNNDDYMYIKTTDGAGFPSIRIFKFEEVNDFLKSSESQINMSEYITKDELFEILKDYKKGGIGNGKQSIQKQSTSES